MLRHFKGTWDNLSLSSKGLLVVGLPIFIFISVGLLTEYALRQTQQLERLVHDAYEVQLELQDLHTLVLDAGSGVRDYLLTGQTDTLERYFDAKDALPQAFETLSTRLQSEPEQLERLGRVREQIEEEVEALGTLLEYSPLPRSDAPAAVDNLILTSQLVMESLGTQFDILNDEQGATIALREVEKSESERRYYSVLALSLLFGTAGGLLGMRLFALGVTRRVLYLSENAEQLAKGQPAPHQTSSNDEIGQLSTALNRASTLLRARETELTQANDAIRLKFDELTQRHHEVILLNRLASRLQSASNVEACFELLQESVTSLCPDTSGGLYLFHKGQNLYKHALSWGDLSSQNEFAPHDCLVKQGGQHYIYGSAFEHTYCSHLSTPYPKMSLCCTLSAQDTPLGILSLSGGAALADNTRTIIGAMADRFSLAIVNLRLRDSLVQQAIRDPLTGLYNRRYLEDTLEREMRRAKRGAQSLSILIADIDHFKRINDTYGHKAGDEVLKAFGRLLSATFRTQDIPCRYGGEEFVMVLPETDLVDARRRAQELAEQVRRLRLPISGRSLNSLSTSIGVATYPEHGRTPQLLLSSADNAMYEAKDEGRDRVVTARTLEQELNAEASLN